MKILKLNNAIIKLDKDAHEKNNKGELHLKK